MKLSRQGALELVDAFHACCALERDIIVVISSLDYYKNSACIFLGEENTNLANSCRTMLSTLYHKVSSACLSMATRCADAITEGEKDEGK